MESACPVVELLELEVDGTGGVLVPALEKYTYITRVVLTYRYLAAGGHKCSKFADDGPLDNGFFMVYRGNHLGSEHPIVANKNLHLYGYDVHFTEHQLLGPGGYMEWWELGDSLSMMVCSSRWKFMDWMPQGLPMWDEQDYFGIKINDDMTAIESLREFKAIILGWTEHD